MPGQEWSVQQGPRWLADLMVSPPSWAIWGAVLLLLASFGVAGYVWHRDGVDEDVQAEILSNGLTAGSCALGTLAAVRLLEIAYVGDVTVGVLVGLAVATRAPGASQRFVEEAING